MDWEGKRGFFAWGRKIKNGWGEGWRSKLEKCKLEKFLVWALKGKRVQVRRARKLQTIFLTL